MMDILLAQALWVLRLLTANRLPEVASDALKSGLDSPSLRMLAGLAENELEEAPKLFESALKEFSFSALSRPESAHIYARAISKQILSGETSPQDGANKLWQASIMVSDPSFHDLDTFIYAASEMQTRTEDKDFFNGEIIKEARVWASELDI